MKLLGEAHWLNCPPWPGSIVTICMSYFTIGSPGKEHRLTKPLQLEEFGKGQKEMLRVLPPPRNPSHWHPSWPKVCTTRKDPESEWLAKENPETNLITLKPEAANHVAEQFSWVPLPSCSLPSCPFPIKSLALLARVSTWAVHFWVLDKNPVLGPGRVSPSCHKT